jgi:hypothetical protein
VILCNVINSMPQEADEPPERAGDERASEKEMIEHMIDDDYAMNNDKNL